MVDILQSTFLFLVVIVVVIAVVTIWGNAVERDRKQEAAAKQLEEDARTIALAESNDALLMEWIAERREEGWAYFSRGKLMHVKGQPECMMLLSGTSPLVRLDEFSFKEGLQFGSTATINLNQIISISVDRPTITRSRKEEVHIPLTETTRKSPVARGLIGGAMLGPAGLVLGAASGLNSKSETTIQTKTVYKDYETLGAPQLIIGTKSDDYPVFKIRCADQQVADEWLYRIRGRMA